MPNPRRTLSISCHILKEASQRLDKVLGSYLALKGDNDVPQRSIAEADRCSLRFRLVTSNSHHLSSNLDKELHQRGGMYVTEVLSAWSEVWGTPWCSKAPIVTPEGRFGQILRFLRFWAVLVI